MKFVASIPATSANLGPGFDSLGIALNLWNHFELELDSGNASISVETNGEGAASLPTDQTHLVAQVLFNEIKRLSQEGQQPISLPPLRLVCHNNVPAGSGLGSSSTAVLGGLILAHACMQWAKGEEVRLEHANILHQAVALEGHGDNVAPALLGDLVIVATNHQQVITHTVKLPPTRVTVCVPDFYFLTSQARSVLPGHISRADAIANIGRASLVVEALRIGSYTLLGQAMSDTLHEPYRLPIIPGAIEARKAALQANAVAVSLSGAGPGMIAFAEDGHKQIGQAMVDAFANAGLRSRFWVLDTIDHGARLTTASS